MASRTPLLTLLSLAACLSSTSFAANEVKVGSPAPKISVKKWLKGKPVETFAPGKTYVVEFWATWCGPCIESIPHLTEMAKANKDVTFVGVGIWEEDTGQVGKFVTKMGAKMDYNVAYSGNQDGMAKTWMAAASQNGIPTAFLIKDKKILWIGHPMELETPLKQVKSGKFDLKKAMAAFEEQAAETKRQRRTSQLFDAANAAFWSGNATKARAYLAEAKNVNKGNPSPTYRATELLWMSKEDPNQFDAILTKLADRHAPEDLNLMQLIALFGSRRAETRDAAHYVASLAVGAKEDVMTLNTALEVYMATKDNDAVVATIDSMMKYMKGDPMYADYIKYLETTRKQFSKSKS